MIKNYKKMQMQNSIKNNNENLTKKKEPNKNNKILNLSNIKENFDFDSSLEINDKTKTNSKISNTNKNNQNKFKNLNFTEAVKTLKQYDKKIKNKNNYNENKDIKNYKNPEFRKLNFEENFPLKNYNNKIYNDIKNNYDNKNKINSREKEKIEIIEIEKNLISKLSSFEISEFSKTNAHFSREDEQTIYSKFEKNVGIKNNNILTKSHGNRNLSYANGPYRMDIKPMLGKIKELNEYNFDNNLNYMLNSGKNNTNFKRRNFESLNIERINNLNLNNNHENNSNNINENFDNFNRKSINLPKENDIFNFDDKIFMKILNENEENNNIDNIDNRKSNCKEINENKIDFHCKNNITNIRVENEPINSSNFKTQKNTSLKKDLKNGGYSTAYNSNNTKIELNKKKFIIIDLEKDRENNYNFNELDKNKKFICENSKENMSNGITPLNLNKNLEKINLDMEKISIKSESEHNIYDNFKIIGNEKENKDAKTKIENDLLNLDSFINDIKSAEKKSNGIFRLNSINNKNFPDLYSQSENSDIKINQEKDLLESKEFENDLLKDFSHNNSKSQNFFTRSFKSKSKKKKENKIYENFNEDNNILEDLDEIKDLDKDIKITKSHIFPKNFCQKKFKQKEKKETEKYLKKAENAKKYKETNILKEKEIIKIKNSKIIFDTNTLNSFSSFNNNSINSNSIDINNNEYNKNILRKNNHKSKPFKNNMLIVDSYFSENEDIESLSNNTPLESFSDISRKNSSNINMDKIRFNRQKNSLTQIRRNSFISNINNSNSNNNINTSTQRINKVFFNKMEMLFYGENNSNEYNENDNKMDSFHTIQMQMDSGKNRDSDSKFLNDNEKIDLNLRKGFFSHKIDCCMDNNNQRICYNLENNNCDDKNSNDRKIITVKFDIEKKNKNNNMNNKAEIPSQKISIKQKYFKYKGQSDNYENIRREIMRKKYNEINFNNFNNINNTNNKIEISDFNNNNINFTELENQQQNLNISNFDNNKNNNTIIQNQINNNNLKNNQINEKKNSTKSNEILEISNYSNFNENFNNTENKKNSIIDFDKMQIENQKENNKIKLDQNQINFKKDTINEITEPSNDIKSKYKQAKNSQNLKGENKDNKYSKNQKDRKMKNFGQKESDKENSSTQNDDMRILLESEQGIFLKENFINSEKQISSLRYDMNNNNDNENNFNNEIKNFEYENNLNYNLISENFGGLNNNNNNDKESENLLQLKLKNSDKIYNNNNKISNKNKENKEYYNINEIPKDSYNPYNKNQNNNNNFNYKILDRKKYFDSMLSNSFISLENNYENLSDNYSNNDSEDKYSKFSKKKRQRSKENLQCRNLNEINNDENLINYNKENNLEIKKGKDILQEKEKLKEIKFKKNSPFLPLMENEQNLLDDNINYKVKYQESENEDQDKDNIFKENELNCSNEIINLNTESENSEVNVKQQNLNKFTNKSEKQNETKEKRDSNSNNSSKEKETKYEKDSKSNREKQNTNFIYSSPKKKIEKSPSPSNIKPKLTENELKTCQKIRENNRLNTESLLKNSRWAAHCNKNKNKEESIFEKNIRENNLVEKFIKKNEATLFNIYDLDFISNLLSKETKQLKADENYLVNHPSLNEEHRAILVDWMMEISEDLAFKRDTFHFAVNYLDRFLSITENIEKNILQLIGICCLNIAGKFEEIYIPKCEEYINITENRFTKDQLISLERFIITTLEWQLNPTCLIMWLNWYLCQWDLFIESLPEMKEKLLKFNHKNKLRLKSNNEKDIIYFKKTEEKCYIYYRQATQLIDALVTDYNHLKFEQRHLIAAVIFIIISIYYELPLFCKDKKSENSQIRINEEFFINLKDSKDFEILLDKVFGEFLSQSFNFYWKDIIPACLYCYNYVFFEYSYDLPLIIQLKNEQYENGNYEDFLSFQTHNKKNFDCVMEVMNISKGKKS